MLLKQQQQHNAFQTPLHWEGVYCGMRNTNAESRQGVICRKFNNDFFCGMKGKVWHENMLNVAKMNIY